MAAKPPSYAAVVGPGANFAGVDQGIDFTAPKPFPIYALGAGTITKLTPTDSGWPGAAGPGTGALLAYHLTGGPAKGKDVYVAESFTPSAGIGIGSTVAQGDVIGVAAGPYPGIETGFADAGGQAFGSPTGGPQPSGTAYNAFVKALSNNPALGGPNPFGTSPFPGGSSLLNQAGSTVSNPVTGAASSVSGAVSGAISSISSVSDLIKWITNTKNLQRVAEMGAGGALILVGVIMLGRTAASSGPAQQTAGAVKAVTPTSPPQARRSAPNAPRTSTRNTGPPLSQSSAATRRKAGFKATPQRERPKRGKPGSSRPAKGERIPY